MRPLPARPGPRHRPSPLTRPFQPRTSFPGRVPRRADTRKLYVTKLMLESTGKYRKVPEGTGVTLKERAP